VSHLPVVQKIHPMLKHLSRPGEDTTTVCSTDGEDWPCEVHRLREKVDHLSMAYDRWADAQSAQRDKSLIEMGVQEEKKRWVKAVEDAALSLCECRDPKLVSGFVCSAHMVKAELLANMGVKK